MAFLVEKLSFFALKTKKEENKKQDPKNKHKQMRTV